MYCTKENLNGRETVKYEPKDSIVDISNKKLSSEFLEIMKNIKQKI